MNKPAAMSGDMSAIFSGSLVQSRHLLFLYTSHVNKYAIQASFFAMSEYDEMLVFISNDETQLIRSRFDELERNISVIHPDNMDVLKNINSKLRIIIDEVLISERSEEFLRVNENYTILSMYDLTRIKPERIRELVSNHDGLILNTPDMTVLSRGFLRELDIADKTIERSVKEYLDIVVLALIVGKPMCGIDILDVIHSYFNVLLSPGTLYPLLHRLKKEGLLECEYYRTKKKVYKPARGSEAIIHEILDEHLLANEFFNNFLKSTDKEVKII